MSSDVGEKSSDGKYFISDLYTGSAADYERADLSHVGTGTGAQSYGWGLYSTDTRNRGEGYANVDAKMKNVRKVVYKGNEYTQRSNFFGNLNGLQGIEKAALMEILSKGSVEEALQKTDDAEVKDFLTAHQNEFEVTQPQDIEGKRNLYRQTWFTNREGEGEANLLVWNEKVTPEQTKAILDGLSSQTDNQAVVDFVNGKRQQEGLEAQDSYTAEELRGELEKYLDLKDVNGNSVYSQLTELLGSMKDASLFLTNECDIDGMKYPANHKDGSKGYNYVSYSDANMRIDEHEKWMVTDELHGHVYDALSEQGKAELDKMVSRYLNTPQWLKAPNGEDTNLTPFQWVQVRTPSFKKWFGDWGAEAEIKAMRDRIIEWGNDVAAFNWAKGKTLEECIDHFGNELKAIAYLPSGYMANFNVKALDNRVYSGKAYFIDHIANHKHNDIGLKEFWDLQSMFLSPDEVIKDNRTKPNGKAKDALIFVKRFTKNRIAIVELSEEEGYIVLHKSLYNMKDRVSRSSKSIWGRPFPNQSCRFADTRR